MYKSIRLDLILYRPLFQHSRRRAHCTFSGPILYAKSSSRTIAALMTDWYPVIVLDHFQKFNQL